MEGQKDEMAKDGRILGSKDGRMKGIRMEGWKNGQEQ